MNSGDEQYLITSITSKMHQSSSDSKGMTYTSSSQSILLSILQDVVYKMKVIVEMNILHEFIDYQRS